MKSGTLKIVYSRKTSIGWPGIIRMLLLLLLLACKQLTASAYTEKKITLSLQSVELKKALSAIEKKSDYRFMYNESVVANKPKIDLQVKDADITEVLRIVLVNNGIAYRILNNNLVVLRSSQDAEVRAIQVSGKVTGPNGAPLSGVSVTIKGTTTGTTTNDNGDYSISVPDENSVLVFSSVGYNAQEVVAGGRTTINVSMEASASQMDNIVVVGYGTARKKKILRVHRLR